MIEPSIICSSNLTISFFGVSWCMVSHPIQNLFISISYGGSHLGMGISAFPYPLRIAPIVKTLVLRFGLAPDGARCCGSAYPCHASIMAVTAYWVSCFKYRHVDSWYLASGRGNTPALSIVTPTLRYSQVLYGVCASILLSCLGSRLLLGMGQCFQHLDISDCFRN